MQKIMILPNDIEKKMQKMTNLNNQIFEKFDQIIRNYKLIDDSVWRGEDRNRFDIFFEELINKEDSLENDFNRTVEFLKYAKYAYENQDKLSEDKIDEMFMDGE